MPLLSRTSLITANGSTDALDVELPMAAIKNAEKHPDTAATAPVSSTTLQGTLPPPVVQGSVSSGRRGKKKSARVDGGLRVHWAQFKRRIGTGTAPSTSSALEPDESGDSYSNAQMRQEAQNDVEDDGVDEVVVDREWSDEIKSSSITHSEHGGTPEKSSNQLGTSTDRESLAFHVDGMWASCGLLIFLRWRVWPTVHQFFAHHFVDEKSEMHYRKENWFLGKVCCPCSFPSLAHPLVESSTVVHRILDCELGSGIRVHSATRRSPRQDILLCGESRVHRWDNWLNIAHRYPLPSRFRWSYL